MPRRGLLSWLLMVAAVVGAGSASAQDLAQPRPIPVGTKWTIERTEGGQTQKTTWTLAGTSVYNGKPVYMLNSGARITLIDVATLNNVGAMRAGKMVMTVFPNEGMFSWPLSVGKTWSASFNYSDYDRSVSITGVESQYRVTGYEDVTVPAGTFKAYRIEGTPGSKESVTRTAWYAPVPGIVVKRIWIRRGSVDYRRTSLHVVMELVEYPQR